jgi:hypothetical protein
MPNDVRVTLLTTLLAQYHMTAPSATALELQSGEFSDHSNTTWTNSRGVVCSGNLTTLWLVVVLEFLPKIRAVTKSSHQNDVLKKERHFKPLSTIAFSTYRDYQSINLSVNAFLNISSAAFKEGFHD